MTVYRTDHFETCPARCQGECLNYIDVDAHGPRKRVYRSPGYVSRSRPAPSRSPGGWRTYTRAPEQAVTYKSVGEYAHLDAPALQPVPLVVHGQPLTACTVSAGPSGRHYHVHYVCAGCGAARRTEISKWRRHALPLCPGCPELKRLRAENARIGTGTGQDTYRTVYIPTGGR